MDLLILSQTEVNTPLPSIIEFLAQAEFGLFFSQGIRHALQLALERLADWTRSGFLTRRVAPNSDYIYIALALVWEANFFRKLDAASPMSLFDLRQSRLLPSAALHRNGVPECLRGRRFAPLGAMQQIIGVLFAVGFPELERRADDLLATLRDPTAETVERERALAAASPAMASARRQFRRFYPIVKALIGVARVLFLLAYVAGKTPYAAPSYWARGVTLRYNSSSHMGASDVPPSVRPLPTSFLPPRSSTDSEAGSRRLLSLLSVLMSALFVSFRVSDWLGRDPVGTELMFASGQRRRVPENPPPSTSLQPLELEALRQPGICPVCARPVVNPCVNVTTGYMACYPCALDWVRAHATCPVKRDIPTNERCLRRVFLQSS
jgi:hypothetical protein